MASLVVVPEIDFATLPTDSNYPLVLEPSRVDLGHFAEVVQTRSSNPAVPSVLSTQVKVINSMVHNSVEFLGLKTPEFVPEITPG